MRVTIINDSTVYVDGVAHVVDAAPPAAPFHALQWDGTRGEIEYSATTCEHCGGRSRKPNETIFDFAPYQKYLDAWHAADAAAKAQHAAGPQT